MRTFDPTPKGGGGLVLKKTVVPAPLLTLPLGRRDTTFICTNQWVSIEAHTAERHGREQLSFDGSHAASVRPRLACKVVRV